MATRRTRQNERRSEGRGEDSRALQVLSLHSRMQDVRGNFNTNWQTVAERVQPNKADFTMQWADGQRRTNKIFDDTAPIALGHGVAALSSMLIPEARRWHTVRPRNKALRNDIKVLQWCDAVTDVLFDVRYSPLANFQNQAEEAFSDILTFGNGPFLVDDIIGMGLRYRCLPLATTWGMENAAGIIDRIHYQFEMTAFAVEDAVRKGIIDHMPAEIEAQYKNRSSTPVDKNWTFVHAIYPNDYDEDDRGDKPVTSCIVCVECKETVKESGYYTRPIFFPRYRVNARETYGRGPGLDVLPTILQLNEMEKADVRITQRAADGPWITADDSALPAFNMRSNAMNPGYMSNDGKPLVAQLGTSGNFEVLKEKLDEKRKIVRTAFLNDIMQALMDHPNMTATQVLQLAQERGAALAPVLGRIQSELLGPMITRELDILHRAGALPEPPDAIKREGRFDYEVQYFGMNQVIQKQTTAVAISQVFQQAAPIFEADPTQVHKLNLERTLSLLVEANGAPAAMMNTPEEQSDKDQAAASQQQLTNMATIAGPASQAIKNIADAHRAMTSPTPVAGVA